LILCGAPKYWSESFSSIHLEINFYIDDVQIFEGQMKYIIFILCSIAYCSLTAKEAEAAEPIFRCQTENNKSIEVYKDKERVTYLFGRDGYPPEIKLTKSIYEAEISMENISGNGLSNSIKFSNGEYTYRVITEIDRTATVQVPKHGVLVKRNASYLTYISCLSDTVQGSLLDLQ
jgi:hypothetical protein